MQPEARSLLWDAGNATGLITTFISGRSLPDYKADSLLRSALERQFESVGEGLNKLTKVDPETAAQIPTLVGWSRSSQASSPTVARGRCRIRLSLSAPSNLPTRSTVKYCKILLQ